LKDEPDVQPAANLEIIPRQLANAEPTVPVRVSEIPFNQLQCPPDSTAGFLGIIPDAPPE
jgi:hypothetical protein